MYRSKEILELKKRAGKKGRQEQVQQHMENIMKWVAFYRKNIHRFVKDYFHVDLKLFQKIVIYMMDNNLFSQFWASRGIGKTFLIAVYVPARCILYPGTKVVIVSGSRDQANLVLYKMVGSDVMGRSGGNLQRELKTYKISTADSKVIFNNGSEIEIAASNDRARGRRCQILIVDEVRLVDKQIVEEVLQHFGTTKRQPPYLELEPYKSNQDAYTESNKEIYMSSAYYKSHWVYTSALAYLKSFLQGKEYFICGLPYQLAIKEGLADRKSIEYKMQEEGFSRSKWQMERECIFYGESEQSFFDFNMLDHSRNLVYPIYPREVYNYISEKTLKYIPKRYKDGEIRVLCIDIAMMGSKRHYNDATAIFVVSCIPKGSSSRKIYERNVIYADARDGGHAFKQALDIRRLYDDFECDYIVIDTAGNGLGVYDALVTDIYDKERLVSYGALNCLNNEEMAARCQVIGAPKVIYAVKASADFNTQCAFGLDDDFKQGKFHLLLNSDDAERALRQLYGYNKLDSYIQNKLLLPYVHTHLLIDEMISLEGEYKGLNVVLKEQRNKRKDRYSSLSYGNYFIRTLERSLTRPIDQNVASGEFLFRSPQSFKTIAGRR